MKKNVLFVGFRSPLHSRFGGYDRIVGYPDSDFLNEKHIPFGFIPWGHRGKRLNLICMDMAARIQRNNYDIIHYFYGDEILFHDVPKHKKSKFIATIHFNAEKLSKKQFRVLKSFDGVICLSKEQEKYLKQHDINAKFIPHGFCKVSFMDSSDILLNLGFDKSKINIVYSGTNYRDFETFRSIAQEMKNEKRIVFHAVGQKDEVKEILKSCQNVIVYDRLPDDVYYCLMHSCDYNFLPLLFATANNSLLEAQSLGVVSILPLINGITDYADMDNNIFYENFDQLIEIMRKIKKAEKNQSLVNFMDTYFSWETVYSQLKQFYASLLNDNGSER
ncbi:MAG: glycosyltransferase [Treponema sp.]|nr:glycosyltransferase [Treponema sp.]